MMKNTMKTKTEVRAAVLQAIEAKMTYQDLLEVLQTLTPEQLQLLQQTVTVEAEDTIQPGGLRTRVLYFKARAR
jgi:hypothetical protein